MQTPSIKPNTSGRRTKRGHQAPRIERISRFIAVSTPFRLWRITAGERAQSAPAAIAARPAPRRLAQTTRTTAVAALHTLKKSSESRMGSSASKRANQKSGEITAR